MSDLLSSSRGIASVRDVREARDLDWLHGEDGGAAGSSTGSKVT
jgi:hypothetical protein